MSLEKVYSANNTNKIIFSLKFIYFIKGFKIFYSHVNKLELLYGHSQMQKVNFQEHYRSCSLNVDFHSSQFINNHSKSKQERD
jgi:hypothetical protein